MKGYSLKIKILLIVGLVLLMPSASFAHEGHDHEATTTDSVQSSVEAAAVKALSENQKKDEKKDNIRKQLNDTIELCSALISKISNLANRVSEREEIIISQGNWTEESKKKLDLLQAELEKTLASANDKIDNSLPKLADTLVNSTKPAKPLKEFRAGVKKVKQDIVTAHKLIIEMIELVKREPVKSDIEDKNEEGNGIEATTTPEQQNS